MSRRNLVSPRLRVIAAAAVCVALAGLLAARVIGSDHGGAPIAAATVPSPKPVVLDQLTIPCWSCPHADGWPLRFRTDLDLIAPLGTGGRNAALWYAAFTKPDGPRAAEADAIMSRRVDHPTAGKILPADDPFLAEAEPWMDQATLRFFPDVYPVEGFRTRIPNLMLALTLARSWVARGQAAESLDDAMADFRRVMRLGRLLRQEDVLLINDLVGLAAIRMGAEAIYDRARSGAKLDLALAAAVIAGEAPAQKLLSGARMTTAEVVPYLKRDAGGSSIVVPHSRFEAMRKIALDSPDRRFRMETCASLSLVASFGSGEQRSQARRTLETLAGSTDAAIAANARWHLANPPDEKHLDQLLAQ
jgi:hypothetical protein